MTNDEKSSYAGAVQRLLRDALKRSGMSARQAASKMDISDTRLRHIVNGFQPAGRGQRINVVAPADTLARIAEVLRVTPDQLEEAGRGDAADMLRARLKNDQGWSEIVASFAQIEEWAKDPMNMLPPDDALRFFDDEALFGEIKRRLNAARRLIPKGANTWGLGASATVEMNEEIREHLDREAAEEAERAQKPRLRRVARKEEDHPPVDG